MGFIRSDDCPHDSSQSECVEGRGADFPCEKHIVLPNTCDSTSGVQLALLGNKKTSLWGKEILPLPYTKCGALTTIHNFAICFANAFMNFPFIHLQYFSLFGYSPGSCCHNETKSINDTEDWLSDLLNCILYRRHVTIHSSHVFDQLAVKVGSGGQLDCSICPLDKRLRCLRC